MQQLRRVGALLSIVLSVPLFTTMCVTAARAQDAAAGAVRITFPQEGQKVRGAITLRWEGVPEGGYAIVKIDGQLRTATAQNTLLLNTFDPNSFSPVKPQTDGPHRISVTAINAAGKQVGTAQVNFIVANEEVAPPSEAEGVLLRHWIPSDRLGQVQRYRIFGESNASIEKPIEAGGATGGGGGSGGEAGGAAAAGWLEAPLDWQVSGLVRRVVRDVGMIDGSANIRTVVQQAFQRQRVGAGGGAAGGAEGGGESRGGASTSGSSGSSCGNPNVKGPWNAEENPPGSCHYGRPLWDPAPETGQYFVKMIQPTGQEINATRKEPTIALADLLPLFPVPEVRPGSGWDTRMVIVAELSSTPRKSYKLEDARIRFTSFENVTTPGGEERRAAKLESYYQLPDNVAKRIAATLSIHGGGSGGGAAGGASGGEGGGSGGAAGGGAAGATQDDESAIQEAMATILVARTKGSRIVWFDIERRLVLRSEDVIDTYYEVEGGDASGGEGSSGSSSSGRRAERGEGITTRSLAQMGERPGGGFGNFGGGFRGPGMGRPGMGGPPSSSGPSGSGEAGAAAPAEPTKVRYNLRILTQFDDRVPPPSDVYTAGVGTPNSNWPHNPDDPERKLPNNRDKTMVQNPKLKPLPRRTTP
ncbi:MAG: hypothetical protein M3347_08935 [Armatimonadota bacterium]|nr:hypothetical protein [Armatimonadota bacterium]